MQNDLPIANKAELTEREQDGNKKIEHVLIIALATAIISIGIFLRLYFFILNRPLWLDEAMLAINLVGRSFSGLLRPLDYNQGAPIAFLFLEKTVMSLFGNRDYVLRIIPVTAGIVSVPLMYLVSKKYVGKFPALISSGLFALSWNLIYYSSEAKQYSSDVIVTLLLLLVVPNCLVEDSKPQAFIEFGIAGSLAIWFSHPSLFVIAGIFLTLGLTFILMKKLNRLIWLIGAGFAWAISLVLVYFVSLRNLATNFTLLNFWRDYFAPLPPWGNFSWYQNALAQMLEYPAVLPISFITIGILIIGVLSFAFRRWQLTIILLAPFLLTLIASALKKYPFYGRFLLFLVPLLLLLLAEGIGRLQIIIRRLNRPFAWLVSMSFVIFFIVEPVTLAYRYIQSPPIREDIRSVMSYIGRNHLNTDMVYVYWEAIPAFEFYAPLYGFYQNDYSKGIKSINDPTKYLDYFNNLSSGQRVWIVFTRSCGSPTCLVDEQKYIMEYLDRIGIRKDSKIANSATTYMYIKK